VPANLDIFGLLLMSMAVLLAFVFWGATAAALALAALIFSILYSKRWARTPRRGKEIGIVDNLINSSGCGWIAIYLGWTVSSGGSLNGAHLYALAFTLSVFGTYPATQIHQMSAKDNYTTAKNYTGLLGAAVALKLTSIFILMTWLLLLWETGPSLAGAQSIVIFSVFSVLFLAGSFQCWFWASRPFHKAKIQFGRLLQLMLLSRVLLIVAVNLN
jgi:hypothetical protein